MHEFKGHIKKAKCAYFNQKLCVTVAKGFTVRLWDSQNRSQKLVMRGHEKAATIFKVDDSGLGLHASQYLAL